jgi:hypothetical protein
MLMSETFRLGKKCTCLEMLSSRNNMDLAVLTSVTHCDRVDTSRFQDPDQDTDWT